MIASELENKQLNKDVRLFFYCYKVANWIGVASPLLKRSSKVKKYVYILYIVALIGFYITFSLHELLGRIEMYTQGESMFYIVIIVDIIWVFLLVLSVITCLLFTVTRSEIWKDFITKLEVSEEEFNRYGLKDISASNQVRSGIRIIILATTTILLNIAGYLQIDKCYIDIQIYTLYNLFAVLFISNTAKLIAVRYNFLSEFLTKAVTKESPLPDRACQKIMEVKVLYLKLNYLMDKYNRIVSWQIFFVPANTILLILVAFNYCIFRNNVQFDLSWKFLVFFSGITSNGLILTIVIVMACDAVEKSGKKFTKTCYLLQDGMAKTELRDELEHLGVFSEKLCPAFYAAGFYKVNQKVLAAIFSIVTTYSIISIQFNTSH